MFTPCPLHRDCVLRAGHTAAACLDKDGQPLAAKVHGRASATGAQTLIADKPARSTDRPDYQ